MSTANQKWSDLELRILVEEKNRGTPAKKIANILYENTGIWRSADTCNTRLTMIRGGTQALPDGVILKPKEASPEQLKAAAEAAGKTLTQGSLSVRIFRTRIEKRIEYIDVPLNLRDEEFNAYTAEILQRDLEHYGLPAVPVEDEEPRVEFKYNSDDWELILT